MQKFWLFLGLVLLIGAAYNIYAFAGYMVLTVALGLAVFRSAMRGHYRRESYRVR